MKEKQADILGIVSASLCIVHCLLVPMLVIYGLINKPLVERWEYLDWVFILLSGLAVFLATYHEHNLPKGGRRLSQWMWAVWAIFAVALLLHDSWVPALYISVLSSVGLAYLHFQHFRKKHLAAVTK